MSADHELLLEPETFVKLNSNNKTPLDRAEIEKLSQWLVKKYRHESCQLIVCNFKELKTNSKLFSSNNDQITETRPLFVVCNYRNDHWLTFCIVKVITRVFLLYKDCLIQSIPEDIRQLVSRQFNNIEFRPHKSNDANLDSHESGFMSLLTLQIMLINLKEDTKIEFINSFADDRSNNNQSKLFFDACKNAKANLSSFVTNSYSQAITDYIFDLSKDENFKRELKQFIESIPLVDRVESFENYQKLLKQSIADRENEEEITNEDEIKIKNARKEAFDIKKLKEFENFKVESDSNLKLDIQKKYPFQMAKFTHIFASLAHSEVNEKLNENLKVICQQLNLDYEKVKIFFVNKKQKLQQQDSALNESKQKNLEEIVNRLASMSPTTADSSVGGQIKTLDALLNEIGQEKRIEFRQDRNKVNLYIQRLKQNYLQVKSSYQEFKDDEDKQINQAEAGLLETEKNKIRVRRLKEWSKAKRQAKLKTRQDLNEAIGVMDRVNELATGGHRLRDAQILSILTFLHHESSNSSGKLCQIETGEGKTTIVAILAAINVLRGDVVDVITSSSVLATDSVNSKKYFFNLLDIGVATNNLNEKVKETGPRLIYLEDVVYGSISNFQFDYLKDSFLGYKTRAGRAFGTLILDEVDSMIIDNASHIAKLSGPLPGMESLKYIYIKIWQKLIEAEQIQETKINTELKSKAEELNNRVELKEISDESAQIEYDNLIARLKSNLLNDIKVYIKDSKPNEIDFLPTHIKDYANKTLDKWIDSALSAKYVFVEDEQYKIGLNNAQINELTIQPIDNLNTGTTLKNTVWQHGLHQFLQLIHNLHLTAETLTSCFISSLGYIRKYKNKIFGLTGTLGSTAEQELISSIYNVRFDRMPAYKQKRFTRLENYLIDDTLHAEVLAFDAVQQVEAGRAALVICETIKTCKQVIDILNSLIGSHDVNYAWVNSPFKIKTYFEEEHTQVTQEVITCGDIIIATNIAGRGTDFLTTKALDQNGGLHVCIGFLPCNQRVEEQAEGRTSRQGNNGSARLIIRKSEVVKLGFETDSSSVECFEAIKKLRDQREHERIDEIKRVKVRELDFQDELFACFTSLYTKLTAKTLLNGEFEFVLDDLKEFWALWLQGKNFEGENLAKINIASEFEEFKREAKEIIGGEIRINPYYDIHQAEYFIKKGQIDKAEKSLHHAISISKNCDILYPAYIKLFEVSIEKGDQFMAKFKNAVGNLLLMNSTNQQHSKYKEDAKEYLNKAKNALALEQNYIQNLIGESQFKSILTDDSTYEVQLNTTTTKNQFVKHLISKQKALNLWSSHVESLINQMNTEPTAGILIQSRVPAYFADLKPQTTSEQHLKSVIQQAEQAELASIGVETTYALKKVHDVPDEIVTAAQVQIGAGLSLLAIGVAFPPALPVASSISNTLITEGICDIALELINNSSDGKFNKSLFIKGKVISYGVSLITMGVTAAMQCPKILNAAKNACRAISSSLRKSKFLVALCETLAKQFDKLGTVFEKLETIAHFNGLNKVDKLNYFRTLKASKDINKLSHLNGFLGMLGELERLEAIGKLKNTTHLEHVASVLFNLTKNVTQTVTQTVVKEAIIGKVVKPIVSNVLFDFKQKFRDHVVKSIRSNLDGQEKLSSYQLEQVISLIDEQQASQMPNWKILEQIFQNSFFSLAKASTSWKLQLSTSAIETNISWQQIFMYVDNICKNLNANLTNGNAKNDQNQVKEIINQLADSITERLFSRVVNTTVHSGKNIATKSFMAFKCYSESKKEEARRNEIIKKLKRGAAAGQTEAKPLSDVLETPVEIYDENGNLANTFGEQYKNKLSEKQPCAPIKLTYFDSTNDDGGGDGESGHWVPKGEDKNWSLGSKASGGEKNNCLFDAVAHQLNDETPASLRDKTIKHLESNKQGYIPTNLYDLAQFNRELMQGGSIKNINFTELYPHGSIEIQMGGDRHAKVKNEFSKKLDELWENSNEYEKAKAVKETKGVGSWPLLDVEKVDKKELMIGTLEVNLSNGKSVSLIAISGDSPLYIREKVDGTKRLLAFNYDDYLFVNTGKPEGKILNLDTFNYTNEQWSRSCAAQKLLAAFQRKLIEMRTNSSSSEVRVKSIKLREFWYSPKVFKIGNQHQSQTDAVCSCSMCSKVLPFATGANIRSNQ